MFEMTIENPSDENLQSDEPLKPQTSTTDPLKISARDKEKSKTRMSLRPVSHHRLHIVDYICIGT